MKSNRKAAIIVGALFVITMIAGGINAYTIDPILFGSLDGVFPNKTPVIIGALLMLVMAVGIALLATVFYPVLKKYNETIAITYVSFRAIECGLLIIGVIVSFFLITLSQEFIKADTPDASYFQVMNALALKVRFSAYQLAMIVLGTGSMMLCYLMYRIKLVPRFISVVGFIGYALLFASALLDLIGVIDTVHGAGAMLYIPGGLFELILFPAWLIVKGFNLSVVISDLE